MTEKHLNFEGLAAALLDRANEYLPTWLPGGRPIGREYTCGDLRGGPGDSCKVNMTTGLWADFASGEQGGDLISLYAAVEGIKQGEAAKRLADQISFRLTPDDRIRPAAPAAVEHELVRPPTGTPRPALEHPKHGVPAAWWGYKDAQGELLFYIARYDAPGGKQIVPWAWSATTNRWVMRGWPPPRPLYGLDLLAARPDAPVMVVEGEKAADAAREMAGRTYVVVTWPNGAKAMDKADWTPLYGRKVLIWPDADEPGTNAGRRVAAILAPHCPEVKIIQPDDRNNGWDAADALGQGWAWSNLVEWAKPRARLIEVSALAKGSGVTAAAQANVTVTAEPVDPATSTLVALWERLGVACTGQGNPICNVDNALRVLENHEAIKDLIWFDEFHQKYFTRWNSDRPREWRDVDELNLLSFMQRDLGMRRMSDDMIHKAAVIFAQRRLKNEPRDWMEGLTWDGTERCEHFFIDFFGAEDNEYSRAVGRNFWVAMIARVFQPGCQADNMVILEGGQGIGKSRALRALGGPWYAEANASVMEKDFFITLHGKFLIEISELNSFGRAEVTRIKQVVSCTTDRYRTPYGRSAEDHPRMSIFVATTNEHFYLRDDTGARRFWPIKCSEVRHMDIPAGREQLFAEAVARFKRGDTWYEMPHELTILEQEARRQRDEWEDVIHEYLIHKDDITVKDIAVDCLRIEVGKLDRSVQMRIANVLRQLGFAKRHRWEGSTQGKVWMRIEHEF